MPEEITHRYYEDQTEIDARLANLLPSVPTADDITFLDSGVGVVLAYSGEEYAVRSADDGGTVTLKLVDL